jgi:DNA-directed RNA polymerase specialized sigma24 family protein
MSALTMATLADAHLQFEVALPALRRCALYFLRHRHRDRDDLLAEVLACCWKAWRGLVERGRDPRAVGITGIAAWAVRHALKGRRIGNHSNGRGGMDIFHRRAQKLERFRVVSYDSGPGDRTAAEPASWKEWLAADHRVSPADEACFRLDFHAWISSLPAGRRMTTELLVQGYRTREVAQRLGVSAAAVSQARRALERSWHKFQAGSSPVPK